jgi:hypothetical protein
MKQTPEFDKIQQQMKKGVITLDGFLGDDTRKPCRYHCKRQHDRQQAQHNLQGDCRPYGITSRIWD